MIQHVPLALSDHQGAGSITALKGNLALAVLHEGAGDIRLAPGDDLFADEQVGFLKIDVEGAEMAVLRGLVQTIERCRPPMMIEVDDTNLEEFERFCSEHRYRSVASMKPYRANTYFLALPV